MKKRWKTSIFVTLFVIILLVSLLTACQKIQKVEKNQVEKITAWTHNTVKYELNEEDSAKFIELYNVSKYEGKGTGEGGTPNFGITVYFFDGAYLRVNDFYGKLEVWLYDADGDEKEWYYISSNELYNYVSELANKIDEISK